MKVVFIEDVPNVAEVGEVKEVKGGYGRNYLLPRKLAVLANSQASHLVEARLKAKVHREAQTKAEMQELAKELQGKEITITAKAGVKERLYGSVTSADIAVELSKLAGREIDKRKVELAEPVRQLGTHDVEVKLYKDIGIRVKLTVVAAEETKEEKEKKAAKKGREKAEEPAAEEKAAEVVEVAIEKPAAKAKKGKKAAPTEEGVAEAVKAEAADKKEKKVKKEKKAAKTGKEKAALEEKEQ